MNHLSELEKMNLPLNEYVIFGSGPIAIRGLRENCDIDILVTDKLWKQLSEKYPITTKQGRPDSIYVGNLQFMKIDYKDWQPNIPDNKTLLTDSELINGYPFVKLEYLLECKKQMEGLKHQQDVEKIKDFLREQK